MAKAFRSNLNGLVARNLHDERETCRGPGALLEVHVTAFALEVQHLNYRVRRQLVFWRSFTMKPPQAKVGRGPEGTVREG
jgi:hypothetical protein